MQVVYQSRIQKRILVSVKQTNQTKLYLEVTAILIDFCKSLPLFHTCFISMEKFKNTNLSCFFKDQGKNPNPTPKLRCVMTQHDLEKGEEAKTSLALPSLPVFVPLFPLLQQTRGDLNHHFHNGIFMPPSLPSDQAPMVLHFTFYKKHKPKRKPRECIMR